MLPDAECIRIVEEILNALEVGEFQIKVNHRKLLDGCFEVCGVPADMFRTICSSIDKLDKSPWAEVEAEIINEKGLAPEIAAKIGSKIQVSGNPQEVVQRLKADPEFSANQRMKEGLEQMELLFKYCDLMGVNQSCLNFDFSLARGLDYYTGVIYEAVLISELGVGRSCIIISRET